VSNVTNFSITGEHNVTIRCQSAYILIADSTLVEIKKIRFINCGLHFSNINAALILHNVIISNTTFQNCFGYAIIGSNIQENSLFKNVKILQDNVILSGHMNEILQLLFQDEYS